MLLPAQACKRNTAPVPLSSGKLCWCEQAQEELAERRLPGTSECAQLDVGYYESVRGFASRVCSKAGRRGGRKVKLLINNAGAVPWHALSHCSFCLLFGQQDCGVRLGCRVHACGYSLEREHAGELVVSAVNHERWLAPVPGIMGLPLMANREDPHMRVNHYGPYLLTRLLLPALAPGARIVFVASRAHEQGRLAVRNGRVHGTPPHWCCLQLPCPLLGLTLTCLSPRGHQQGLCMQCERCANLHALKRSARSSCNSVLWHGLTLLCLREVTKVTKMTLAGTCGTRAPSSATC